MKKFFLKVSEINFAFTEVTVNCAEKTFATRNENNF